MTPTPLTDLYLLSMDLRKQARKDEPATRLRRMQRAYTAEQQMGSIDLDRALYHHIPSLWG